MIYFVETEHPTRLTLIERGFPADLAALAGLPGAHLVSGPGGKAGCLFRLSDAGLATPPPYRPIRYDASQRWFRRPDGIWFGWDEPPKAAHLARSMKLRGHNVRLRNGEDWEVPALRLATGETGLPKVFRLGEDGKTIRAVAEQYAQIQEFVSRSWSMVIGESTDLTDDECFDGICAALRLNYRIEPSEVAAMELIADRTELVPCIHALCDLPALMDLLRELEANQKKTASEGAHE